MQLLPRRLLRFQTAVILSLAPYCTAAGYAGDDVHFLKSGIAIYCVLLLTACQALQDETDPNTVSVRGVKPTLEQLNISSTTNAQNAFVNDLIVKVGFVDANGRALGLAQPSQQWAIVTQQGIYEIGRQCDQYLDVLFHFNRDQRAVRQGVTAIGAATASILGIASVAAAPIAITAAAFGLTASLFDAGANSVLYTIEPSALRYIVLKGRKGYLDTVNLGEVNTRPMMLMALQGYLRQCSPATIEGNVNRAASGAPSVASDDEKISRREAGLAAPGATSFIGRAEKKVDEPVKPPPVLTESLRAGNARPGEDVSKPRLMAAQRALGVDADGNYGASSDSKTRAQLKEYQFGWNRRNPDDWPSNEVTGELTRQTATELPYLTPLSTTPFQTAFERSYLGNATGPLDKRLTRPDPKRLKALVSVVAQKNVPEATTPEALTEQMQVLHDALKTNPLTKDKGGVLNQATLDALIPPPTR